MIVHYDTTEFPCYAADKMHHEVILYDENHDEIMRISNIYGSEWNFISVSDGDWSYVEPPEPIPDPEPSDIEVLQKQVRVLQANLDYCLMLLEDV